MITTRFEGHFLVEIQCSTCEFETFNFETFAELNLDIANYDQNQENILKMREKFKKSHINSQKQLDKEVKAKRSRRDSKQLDEIKRKNSAMFDLEDSIFKLNQDNEMNLSSRILNKKSTIKNTENIKKK